MIPVGVGRGVMSSLERLARQEKKTNRKKKIEANKEVGKKSGIIKVLFGNRL